ncbi:unnamed protein product [Brassicogethes aeneus]|uniref:Pleiotrophin/Midkine C-terminal domain-containing protein n=1 Tax=Brassicogethes aeneus TaxID=1431903 RepID=A0A9P0FCG2_BRAAE|nr:unnamed protein product [Brassicogethes aeneus]
MCKGSLDLSWACRYEKGAWAECNAQSQMTRNDKLKPNSDASCEQNRQITKKCKPKGAKPTKGKGNRYKIAFLSAYARLNTDHFNYLDANVEEYLKFFRAEKGRFP